MDDSKKPGEPLEPEGRGMEDEIRKLNEAA